MVSIQYPILNKTAFDEIEPKELAIEILQKVSNSLIDALAMVNYQLEHLKQ